MDPVGAADKVKHCPTKVQGVEYAALRVYFAVPVAGDCARAKVTSAAVVVQKRASVR